MDEMRPRRNMALAAAVLAATGTAWALWLAASSVRPRPLPPPHSLPVLPAVVQVQARPELPPPPYTDRLVILMYHHLGTPAPRSNALVRDLTVTPQRLEGDLRLLQRQGLRARTLAEACDLLRRDMLPERTVVLTFDDGYLDNYTRAYPLLRRYGCVGTFSIVAEAVGRPGHMDPDQLRELVAAGNEVASHTLTHPDLRRLAGERLQNEVRESKRQLEALLRGPVDTFCYPSGQSSPEAREAVREAGYLQAVITGSDRPATLERALELPRSRIKQRTDLGRVLGPLLGRTRVAHGARRQPQISESGATARLRAVPQPRP